MRFAEELLPFCHPNHIDKANSFEKNLFQVFRNVLAGNVICLTEDDDVTGKIYLYIRKLGSVDNTYYDLVVTNIFANGDLDYNDTLMRGIWEFAKEENAKTISFLYVTNLDTMTTTLRKRAFSMRNFKSYMLININDITVKEMMNRNIKRAMENLTVFRCLAYNEFLSVLLLYNRKIRAKDPMEMLEAQAHFLSTQKYRDHVLAFYLKVEDVIVAGIISVVIGGIIYMLVNNYNSDYLKYYPNDYLYYVLICNAHKNNIRHINWGEVNVTDYGLQHFKRKYSNIEKDKTSVHYLTSVNSWEG